MPKGLADEIKRFQRQVQTVGRNSETPEDWRSIPAAVASDGTPANVIRKACWLYRSQMRRNRYFGRLGTLFSDPAFDLLLSIFVHTASGHDLSVSSAVSAARMSPTTGLRWADKLTALGFIQKVPHPTDQRMVLISLTELGRTSMITYLDNW